MRLKHKLGIAVLAIMLALCLPVALAIPDGTNIAAGNAITRGFFASGTIGAQGGNSTNLNASSETQTIAWQGFFGEVLGNITLSDTTGDQLYAWLAGTQGSVFASRDSSINFASIAGQTSCTIDENLTGTGSDRVNNTFTLNTSIAGWSVGSTTISSACQTFTYVTSSPQNSSFEEIILTDDAGTTAVYTTKIEQDSIGFDNSTHDFQMVVPDFKNESTTTYFFYAELT